jgi:hypothetical protein
VLHPLGGVRIAGDVEEPGEHRDAVASSEPEAGCEGPERLDEGARVVEDVMKRLGDDPGYGVRLFPVERRSAALARAESA